MWALTTALLTLFIFASPSLVWARGNCDRWDEITGLIHSAKGGHTWDQSQWGEWEMKLTKVFDEVGYQGDAVAISKSVRRNMKPESKAIEVGTNHKSPITASKVMEVTPKTAVSTSSRAVKTLETLRVGDRSTYERFQKWIHKVESQGIHETRRSSGYHDEVLRELAGCRSVRLSDIYRIYYKPDGNGSITVIDIDRHKYPSSLKKVCN